MRRIKRIFPIFAIAMCLGLVPCSEAQLALVNVGHINNGGAASRVAVSGNHVYLANGGDGLRIYAVKPQLKMELAGTNTLLFSWPAPAAFARHQNPGLASGDWVTVTNLPSSVGAQSQLVLPMPASSKFYRLVAQ